MKSFDAPRDPHVMFGHNVNMHGVPWLQRLGKRNMRKVDTDTKKNDEEISRGMHCDLVVCELEWLIDIHAVLVKVTDPNIVFDEK